MGFVLSPTSRVPGELAGYLHAVHRIGTRWVSTDVQMSIYAPSPDVLDFSTPGEGRLDLDTVVNQATQEKLLLNQKIFGVPAWLASDTSAASRAARYRACYVSAIKDKDGYEKVVSTMAARYKGKIRSYEFGNSPLRSPGYGNCTPEEFVRDVGWTHDGVKAGDPTALVCAAGFVQKNDIVPLLLKTAPNSIDVLTVHYITAELSEIAGPAFYDDLFKEVGFRKPMWDTSAIGIPRDDLGLKRGTNVTMNTVGAHEEGVIRSVVRNISIGVGRTMFACLNLTGEPYFFTIDNQPTSSVCEYATAANQIDGAIYTGKTLASDVKAMEGYYFQRGDDVFLVAWNSVNGSGAQLDLPAKGATCQVVDRFGRSMNMPAAGGKVSVAVGFRPMFIHGLTPPADAAK